MRLHVRGHRTSKVLGTEIAASTVVSMMLSFSRESGEVPANELIHRGSRDYTRCFEAEIASVHIRRGSSLSTVGCRCRTDGFAGVPRDG